MKKQTFNYNPSNRDLIKAFHVLWMKSGTKRFIYNGKCYTGDPTKEMAPNGAVYLDNIGWHMTFDVVKTDKYISFVRYYTEGSTYSLANFKAKKLAGEDVLVRKGFGSWSYNPDFLNGFEQWVGFRLYPDNTIAAYVTAVNKETKEARTFQLSLEQYESSDWYDSEVGLVHMLGGEPDDEYLRHYGWRRRQRGRDLTLEDAKKIFTEIYSEDDLKPQHLSKKTAKIAYNTLISSGMSAKYIYDDGNIVCERDYLPQEWKEFFPDLFGKDGDERKAIAYTTADEHLCDHRILEHGEPTKDLYVSLLFANLGITDSYLGRRKKTADTANEIWNEYWDDEHENEPHSLIFKRCGNMIAVSLARNKENYWDNLNHLFLYDTKTHKRKILSGKDTHKALPLTFDNVITFAQRCEHYNPFGDKSSDMQESKIYVKGDLAQVLANTTVGWILESYSKGTLPNLEGFKEAILLSERSWDGDHYMKCNYTLGEWIVRNHDAFWYYLLLKLLVQEKPILEQMAKCGLWNLFSSSLRRDRFIMANDTVSAKEADCFLIYNPKKKALTDALGMRMEQLKIVNDTMISGPDGDACISMAAVRQLFNLDEKELKAIDKETFSKMVLLGRQRKNDYYGYRNSIADDLIGGRYNRNEHLKALIDSFPGIRKRIDFLYKYFIVDVDEKNSDGNNITTYEDYLSMRKQLKTILEAGALEGSQTDAEELDRLNKDFPEQPTGGTVFYRYVPGAALRVSNWGGRDYPSSAYDFVQRIRKTYNSECVKEIYNENHILMGVVLTLNPMKKVQYLHDELSIWMSMKKDTHDRTRFTQASKEAQKLEYVSERYGLRIIAPTEPEDLRREGAVLSHCVGSYVQAVCSGAEKILFIRRNDMPQDPYFTMDVTPDGSIRQVHCYANGDPTPVGISEAFRRSGYGVYDTQKDIIGFLMEWAEKTPGIKKSSIQSRYGLLCALAR